jgi:hypothetical protein
MKIISQFRKLQEGSKIALRYRKYITEVFHGNRMYDFGVKITIASGRPVSKEYEKFSLFTEKQESDLAVIINSKVESEDELEVFAYLIEYVLFELSKKNAATPVDIKKYIDDWIHFSNGKAPEISIEKQVGLIGELLVFADLTKAFPASNQLNNWHGPEGAKIDFVFSDMFGLEVKSRIQPFNDWISISSAEQLDNNLDSQHMAVCDFLPSDSGKTLKEYSDDVISLLDDRDRANDLIEKMRKAKFDYFTDYSNLIKVTLFSQAYYDTKDGGFPILRKGHDLRIDKIKYNINISGLVTIEFRDTLSKVRSQQELS